MGKFLFDQYSLLHAASGVLAYFWGFSLKTWIVLNIVFEIAENTNSGMYIINNYIYRFSPMNKEKPDSPMNMIGDVISGIIGWLSAYYLDILGKRYGWYRSKSDIHRNMMPSQSS